MKVSRIVLLGLCTALVSTTASAAKTTAPDITDKLQAYIGCINRLSERAQQSQSRYTSWAGKAAALNTKPKNILGLYEIYDPTDCAKDVQAANAAEPRHPGLEGAGSDYVSSAVALNAILKTANDYYDQSNYKDDKMAAGKAMHPKLLEAYASFDKADNALRGFVESISDEQQLAALLDIEKTEGRNGHYMVEAMMINAKALVRAASDTDEKKMDLAKVTTTLGVFEASIKELEDYAARNPKERINSMLISNSKAFLVSAKELMRRVRDKVPYSDGDRMMMSQPGAGWMVQGSQPRLTRDYNQLIETYNRH
jgi:Protein of unknown function (DUF3829)